VAGSDRVQVDDIYRAILAHIADNPDAQDTFEGVIRWWLLDQTIRFEIDKVSTSLAQLVARGLIIEHSQFDGTIAYKVNKEKLEEIRALVHQSRFQS